MRDLLVSGKTSAADLPSVRISADEDAISYIDTHDPKLIPVAMTVIALNATAVSVELFERTVTKNNGKQRHAMVTTIELPTNSHTTQVLSPDNDWQGFARSGALNQNARTKKAKKGSKPSTKAETIKNPKGLTPALASAFGYLARMVEQYGDAACVTHKEIKPIIELQSRRLGIADYIDTLTYGSMRGSNDLEHADNMVMIGAQSDYTPLAIQIAMAISKPSDNPIIVDKATPVKAMIEGYQGKRLLTLTHIDPRVERLANTLRSSEAKQALARNRAINKATGQCTSMVASDYHIEGLHIDQFIEYDTFINEGSAHYLASVLAANPDKPFMQASDFGHVEKHQQRAKEGITPRLFEQVAIAISEGRAGLSGVTAVALKEGRKQRKHWIVCKAEHRTEAISEAIKQGYKLHDTERKPDLDYAIIYTEADYTETIDRYTYQEHAEQHMHWEHLEYGREHPEADQHVHVIQQQITPPPLPIVLDISQITAENSTLETVIDAYDTLCTSPPIDDTDGLRDFIDKEIDRLGLVLEDFASRPNNPSKEEIFAIVALWPPSGQGLSPKITPQVIKEARQLLAA